MMQGNLVTLRKLFRSVLVLSALALFVPLVTPVSAQSVARDYLPFSESKLRPFPLKRTELTREALMRDEGVTIAGVRIREEERPRGAGAVSRAEGEGLLDWMLVFSGRDLEGREWRVVSGVVIHYEAVYEGDLDRNGRPDLVLCAGTGGNGLAPPTHLIFLTFDRRGRPTLFQVVGHFEALPDRIFDVADVDGDGRAELLYMGFNGGYWITNLYRVRESRWSRVKGRFAGLNFPLYTRFTRRPNHRPVRPPRGRRPLVPEWVIINDEEQRMRDRDQR
jgi:hypothetical protein